MFCITVLNANLPLIKKIFLSVYAVDYMLIIKYRGALSAELHSIYCYFSPLVSRSLLNKHAWLNPVVNPITWNDREARTNAALPSRYVTWITFVKPKFHQITDWWRYNDNKTSFHNMNLMGIFKTLFSMVDISLFMRAIHHFSLISGIRFILRHNYDIWEKQHRLYSQK